MATDDELDELACVFATFAEETYHGSSPLYYALAKGVSEDRDLLGIASSAHMSPVPNFLFGAVHYLLLGGTTSTLVRHYPLGQTLGDYYACRCPQDDVDRPQ